MKFTKMKQTVALLLAFLGLKEIPINSESNQVDFSAEQEKLMTEKFGDEMVQKMKKAFNQEIKEAKENNLELKAIQDEIDALVKEAAQEANLSENEIKEIVKNENPSGVASGNDSLESLKTMMKAQASLIKKLIAEDAPENAQLINLATGGKMKHSDTHLFATGKQWDAFENRPWNQRMRDLSAKASDFNDKTYVPLLEDDLEHFVRENPSVLESLFNDMLDLPADWDRRSGVLDRVADGYIMPDEIVQGRKKGWSPKNNFLIQAEEGRVYRKKIDITFSGYELQEIENTWIRNYNREGSHPWKMTFVGFLLGELIKQQRLDDRKAQINGIYVAAPDGDVPGKAVESQNGLLYLFWLFRDVKKQYRPFTSTLGEPTKANIVDYVKEFIESIPETERKEEGLELGLTEQMLLWYRETAGLEYQLMYKDDQGMKEYKMSHPIDYSNIKFQPIRDMVKTKFMYITKSKNIQILDYDVNEKSKFTFDTEKRDLNIFADYRLGIRLKFVGTKTQPGDPLAFEKQKVWSNDMPVFDNATAATLFVASEGILKYTDYNGFNHYKVDDAFANDIITFDGFPSGIVLKISGNTKLPVAKNVVNSANVILAGGANFDLKSGGTLTLFVRQDGKLIEVSRTNAPEGEVVNNINYSTATIDANLGTSFVRTGTGAITVNNIINGVEGKVIKIAGGTAAVTIASVSGVIQLTASATLANGADFVELMKINGVWVEISRTIA